MTCQHLRKKKQKKPKKPTKKIEGEKGRPVLEPFFPDLSFEGGFPLRCIQTVFVPVGLTWLAGYWPNTIPLPCFSSFSLLPARKKINGVFIIIFNAYKLQELCNKVFEYSSASIPTDFAYVCSLPGTLFTNLPRLFPLRETHSDF